MIVASTAEAEQWVWLGWLTVLVLALIVFKKDR